MDKADIILKSSAIFTAKEPYATKGFVAIKKNKILEVGKPETVDAYIGEGTKIFELEDRLICPGFVDVHCFFTGYVLGFVGVDLSSANTESEVLHLAREYGLSIRNKTNIYGEEKAILGHGWDSEKIKNPSVVEMDLEFKDRPVVLFAKGGETCWMNTAAQQKYDFTPETCYPEAYWRLLREVLTDRPFIVDQFKDYMAMLNKRGITAVKEMGFDDFYGFTDILEEMERKEELSLRVSFMSQPVGAGANLNHGIAMRDRFKGDFLEFSGYNRMTDGSISCLCGDLKIPYNCSPDTLCAQEIDYEMIEKEVLAVDEAGFRFSLHAQGDGAISKVLNIYDKCQKAEETVGNGAKGKSIGKLRNRHSMTDLEFSDPSDLERMGKLGVIAEVYPQIMSLGTANTKIPMIEEKIGRSRGQYYWNRRKMADSGVVISCGTDLPLLIPDIPESIFHACGGFFPEGGEPFNRQNTLSIDELLTAWTKGGQYNLYHEEQLGTLEAGKLADIAVLDSNVFKVDFSKMRDVKVYMTIIDGKIVYKEN